MKPNLFIVTTFFVSLTILVLSSPLRTEPEPNTSQANEPPNPLTLRAALAYADHHPVVLTKTGSMQSLQPQPLYLNCHNLAFNNRVAVDTQRDTRMRQLVAPEIVQQIEIMQRFFDVQLADLAVMADNESMASAYVRYDRARKRMELKQYSELTVAEQEVLYYETLQKFKASSALQQLTRVALAQAINQPEYLPRDLGAVRPFSFPKVLPELAGIIKNTNNNQWLQKQKQAQEMPARQILNSSLREYVTELLLRLELLKTLQQRIEKESNWRDLKLEQSRMLYEQEVKSDLGDSMAQQTTVQFKQRQVLFCGMLTWVRLNVLQGKALLSPPEQESKQPLQQQEVSE